METSSLWKILSFKKENILLYLIFGVILTYIWKISNISINYIFPFIILCMIIFLKQYYLYSIELEKDRNLLGMQKILLDGKYNELEGNDKILYWLNDIYIYNTYNPTNFILLLKTLNKFYLTRDIYTLHLSLKTYENFIYSLPIEILKDHYLHKIKLINILYKQINNPKRNMIEMQTLIPYNFDINDYNNLI